MRRLGAVVVGVLAAIGLFSLATGVLVVRGGFSARAKASGLETAVAEGLRDLATPRSAAKAKNPVAASPEALEHGRAHWAHECAGCHGLDGKGSDVGRRMFPPAPELARTQKEMSDGEIHYVIENGVRFSGMPGFAEPGDADEEREHWEVIHFIRHLPGLTPAEVEKMEREQREPPGGDEHEAGHEGHGHP